MYSLNIKNKVSGRAVGFSDDGKLFLSRKYELYTYSAEQHLELIASVPTSWKRKVIASSRLLCRLFRHELRGAGVLSDGTKIAATRKGLFYGNRNDMVLKPAKVPLLDPSIIAPSNITITSDEKIIWGEYWSNPDLRPVRILTSFDKGRTYEIVWRSKPNEIKHIHSVVEDRIDNCYWVLAGDHFEQSGIGRLSKDFKSFEWLVKGEQKYRAVYVFPLKDRLVYGTDSEKEPDHICSLDKNTGKWERICEIPGSCIYGAKFGKWYTISTTSEYFDFETVADRMATLWVSKDCESWHQVFAAEKDIWNKKYFQFGSLLLPRGEWESDEIVFSGQAVKEYDDVVCIAEIIED
jgi:hypothetical protein